MSDGRVNNGGKREGAGRKSTRHEYVPDGKTTPLEYILAVMHSDTLPSHIRMEAAKAAIPYCSARLQNTQLEVDADLNITLVSYLDLPAEPDT